MHLGSVLSFQVQRELDLPGAVLVVRPIQSCPDLGRVAISLSKEASQEAGWGASVDTVQEHETHSTWNVMEGQAVHTAIPAPGRQTGGP